MSQRIYGSVYEELVVPAGKSEYGFGLNAPHYGRVVRLVVKQTGGASVNFTVNLYDRRVVESSEGPGLSLPKELFQVTPTVNAIAGNAAQLRTESDGYAYFNNTTGPAAPERKLWLAISPESTLNDTTWSVAITIAEIV